MVGCIAFNLEEPSIHPTMIFKTIISATIAIAALTLASCQPIQKDPYNTGDLYGYPDAGANPDADGSLYDIPADFEEGGIGAADPAPESTTYTVVAGDTLSKISKMHNVSVRDIADANNISNPNLLRVGQTLIIPGR